MKKYQIIYADPPWIQKGGCRQKGYNVIDGKQVWINESNISRDLPYKQMTAEEICNLPIQQLTDNNCHLYIWATNKSIKNVFEVINSWGFQYSTTIVWAKNQMGGGLGGIHRVSTEFLLFAKKGILSTNKTIRTTWHNVKRDYVNGHPKHSKKPEYFRHLIESIYDGNFLELFARDKVEGWDVWGNEVESDIELNGVVPADDHETHCQALQDFDKGLEDLSCVVPVSRGAS